MQGPLYEGKRHRLRRAESSGMAGRDIGGGETLGLANIGIKRFPFMPTVLIRDRMTEEAATMGFFKRMGPDIQVERSNDRVAFSDLISYVMRYARPSGKGCRVLELGCGAGANIPFFKSLGAEYFGIEGSGAVVEMLLKKRRN